MPVSQGHHAGNMPDQPLYRPGPQVGGWSNEGPHSRPMTSSDNQLPPLRNLFLPTSNDTYDPYNLSAPSRHSMGPPPQPRRTPSQSFEHLSPSPRNQPVLLQRRPSGDAMQITQTARRSNINDLLNACTDDSSRVAPPAKPPTSSRSEPSLEVASNSSDATEDDWTAQAARTSRSESMSHLMGGDRMRHVMGQDAYQGTSPNAAPSVHQADRFASSGNNQSYSYARDS